MRVLLLLAAPLSLQARAGHAFDEVALREDEDEHGRQDGDGGSCHDEVRAFGGASFEHHERERKHMVVGVAGVDDDEGPDEAVPGVEEGKSSLRGDGGHRNGHNNAPQNRQAGGPVDEGGFFELFGDAEEELAHQEGAIGGKDPGHDQRGHAIYPSDSDHELIHRNNKHHEGNHDGAKIKDEELVSSGEAQASKSIAAQHGGDDLSDDDEKRDQNGVGEATI